MSGARTYLRAVSGQRELARAGSRATGNALLELIQRRSDGPIERRHITVQEAQADTKIAALLAPLTAPRPALAGLALDRPRLMGIVNVTPDSFSDGNLFADPGAAIAHALALEAEGADILDIGAESTRPGAQPVSLEEEWRRLQPVLAGLLTATRAPISLDTRKPEVMHRAAGLGVHLINDVSALTWDAESLRVAAETGLPVVLMHAQGDPRTMQANPTYDDVLLDVYDWLEHRIDACVAAGIGRERLIIDPGIGFGKTLNHNLELMAGLSLFHGLGCPVLLGASRKAFIGALTGVKTAAERVTGSVAAALAGAAQGAQLLRVHDVAATRQALAVWEAVTAGHTRSQT
jgi:dihydropteroate synthase